MSSLYSSLPPLIHHPVEEMHVSRSLMDNGNTNKKPPKESEAFGESAVTFSAYDRRANLGPVGRFFDRFSTLFRSLGLSILTFVFSDGEETPKILIRRSRIIALAQCTIHILPACVCFTLTGICLAGYFIGDELHGQQNADDVKLSALQVAAKLQELLMMSSMGCVIFHFLREELVNEGLPLGLVVSGYSFSQLSYIWSPELWGGMLSGQKISPRHIWRRRLLILLIFIGGVIAVFAGPSSAILMIPSKKDWHVGGGIYWINGSDSELWPTNIDSSYYSDLDCSSDDARFGNSACPSAGYTHLYRHYSNWGLSPLTQFQVEIQDADIRKNVYIRPAIKMGRETYATTAHTPTAILQDAMADLHVKALKYLVDTHPIASPGPRSLKWADYTKFNVQTKAPFTRVVCLAQDNVDIWSGKMVVDFPHLEETGNFWSRNSSGAFDKFSSSKMDATEIVRNYLKSRNITTNKSTLFDSETFVDDRQVLAVPVDIWDETASSLGLILFFDRNRRNRDSGVVGGQAMACSIDARWAKATSRIQTSRRNHMPHNFNESQGRNVIETHLSTAKELDIQYVKPPGDDMMDMIRLHPDWYKMFAPTAPARWIDTKNMLKSPNPKDTSQTTLETLIQLQYDRDGIWGDELYSNPNYQQQLDFAGLIAASVSDSLSRCGMAYNQNSSRFLQGWYPNHWEENDEKIARTLVRRGDVVESFPEPDILKGGSTQRMVMEAQYYGYIMAATGSFDYFSVIILLLYATIAIAHTIFLVYSGRTSNVWDSILELIILAHKSPPPPPSTLANTSAGIGSLKSMERVACVELAEVGGSVISAGEQLRFRVKEDDQEEDILLAPKADTLYGEACQSVELGSFKFRGKK